MKIKGLVLITVVATLILTSCGKSAIQSSKMKDGNDSLAYAFGIVNYNALLADSLTLDPMLVAKAMLDGEKGDAQMTDDDARNFIMIYINKREEAKAAEQAELDKALYADYIKENEDFLVKNKERSEVTTTASGLQYEVIKMGNGPMPTAESTVKVHYVGTLINGTKFDSSIDSNEPAQFPVSGVIAGWTEALQLMPVGSKFKIYLPQSIAYGAQAAGEMIQPYSTLVFEVELLEIVQ